jgi:hypothetical protein
LPVSKSSAVLGYPQRPSHNPSTEANLNPRKQQLYSIAFALGVSLASASVLAGIGYALQHERRFPNLQLGVGVPLEALLARGDTAAALRELEVAAQIGFGDPAALARFERAAKTTGDSAGYLRALGGRVALQPRAVEPRVALVEALLAGVDVRRTNQPGYLQTVDRAIAQAELLTRFAPQQSRSHAYLGMALLARNAHSGDPAEARRAAEHLRRTLQLGNEDPEALQALEIASRRAQL